MNYLDIVLSIILAVLTGFIIPLITRKLGNERAAEIEKWTSVFVQAAEQMGGTGQVKKQYVLAGLMSKYDMDETDANALIESEVLKLNLTEKE